MNFGLGAHIDSSEGILESAYIIKKINGNILQLFVKYNSKEDKEDKEDKKNKEIKQHDLN